MRLVAPWRDAYPRRLECKRPFGAVARGRRYTLAMCRVRTKQSIEHVLRTLLARLVTLEIRIKLLLLDRGFYSVRVMHNLLICEWPFIIPAVKRGKKPTTPGGPTGTYALAAEKHRSLWWLMMEVARHDRPLRKIAVYHDLYDRAQAFGTVFNY
jgi:hypothetical protein